LQEEESIKSAGSGSLSIEDRLERGYGFPHKCYEVGKLAAAHVDTHIPSESDVAGDLLMNSLDLKIISGRGDLDSSEDLTVPKRRSDGWRMRVVDDLIPGLGRAIEFERRFPSEARDQHRRDYAVLVDVVHFIE
jgi:hypothetical protein